MNCQVWQPAVGAGEIPVTVRSYYWKLVQQVQGGEPPAHGLETHTMRGYRVMHLKTRENYRAGADVLLNWMGQDRFATRNLLQAFPHIVDINMVTGEAATPQEIEAGSAGRCPQDRFCKHCCISIDLMGRSWHAPSIIDLLVHQLELFWRAHLFQNFESFLLFKLPPHKCGKGCTRRSNQWKAAVPPKALPGSVDQSSVDGGNSTSSDS